MPVVLSVYGSCCGDTLNIDLFSAWVVLRKHQETTGDASGADRSSIMVYNMSVYLYLCLLFYGGRMLDSVVLRTPISGFGSVVQQWYKHIRRGGGDVSREGR